MRAIDNIYLVENMIELKLYAPCSPCLSAAKITSGINRSIYYTKNISFYLT